MKAGIVVSATGPYQHRKQSRFSNELQISLAREASPTSLDETVRTSLARDARSTCWPSLDSTSPSCLAHEARSSPTLPPSLVENSLEEAISAPVWPSLDETV